MFEDVSYESILNRLLASVRDDMDKRESSLIYAALASTAFELIQNYVDLSYASDQAFPDTADREHLIMLAKALGIVPKIATNTKVMGKFNIEIELATRFRSISKDYIFYTIEPCTLNEGDGYYYAQLICETAGDLPDDSYLGPIVPIDVTGSVIEVENLATAELVAIVERGADEEDTESFRKRYFLESEWEHYGGNIADYENMCATMNGIGAVKVIPVWNGGGTVKLVLLDTDMLPPSEQLCANYKELIDPIELEGEGYGKAPIDHVVTITPATGYNVDVAMELVLAEGLTFETVKAAIVGAIESYFKDIRGHWKEQNGLIVRISYIESAVLDIDGVVDITGTTLNGEAVNAVIDEYGVPILGSVTAI